MSVGDDCWAAARKWGKFRSSSLRWTWCWGHFRDFVHVQCESKTLLIEAVVENPICMKVVLMHGKLLRNWKLAEKKAPTLPPPLQLTVLSMCRDVGHSWAVGQLFPLLYLAFQWPIQLLLNSMRKRKTPRTSQNDGLLLLTYYKLDWKFVPLLSLTWIVNMHTVLVF